MLKNPKLYSPENVERARYAQIGVLVFAVAVSGYLAVSTFSAIRQVWKAQGLLSSARLESGNLSRQAATLKSEEAKQPRRHEGGVDVLALQLSRWATEQQVKVESVTPQGAPTASDIAVGNASLGTWNAVKVRVEGHGDYPRVMGLLGRFRDPGMPVKLESFSFQSASAGDNDAVDFDLMLTIYERKIEAS